jgi:hypothetical protein
VHYLDRGFLSVALILSQWYKQKGVEPLALLFRPSVGFRQKLPFFTVDPETHPALVPMLASGGDDGRCSHSGSPSHGHQPPPYHCMRSGASSSHTLLLAR